MNARRLRRARGFTLVELMISLVMGLIVAMAAVSLARTATTTFHEQARLSVTEMAVRAASDRLRQDLMRVAYMGTGNISADPKTAHRADRGIPYPARVAILKNLRGIRINTGGSPVTTAAANALEPSDSIDLVGNYTSDDSYGGTITSGGGCGGQVITLDPALDTSVSLMGGVPFNDNAMLANAKLVFPADGKGIVRVTDGSGCKHYVPVCGVSKDASSPARLLVSISADTIDGAPGVMYANDAFADGETSKPANSCGASNPGPVTIAPLSWIRWQLAPTQVGAVDTPLEGTKYDLVRSVCDWSGYSAATCSNPITEVIAEYGVDLKFGITVNDPSTNALAVYDIDDALSATKIGEITAGDVVNLASAGPHNVRSVRYRVAVRTSLPDQDQDLDVDPGTKFRARYCPAPGCTKWAKVRTIVSEIALMNQAGMDYR